MKVPRDSSYYRERTHCSSSRDQYRSTPPQSSSHNSTPPPSVSGFEGLEHSYRSSLYTSHNGEQKSQFFQLSLKPP